MIVAIMQPYLLPYLGYMQLMEAADVLVLHDDVQYIKGGWINRNRIVVSGHVVWLTVPVMHGNAHLPINQRLYLNSPDQLGRLSRVLGAAYPGGSAEDLWRTVLINPLAGHAGNVARVNADSLRNVAGRLGVRAKMTLASELEIPSEIKGQERVIAICRRMGASQYVNPISGAALYHERNFSAAGIELTFMRTLVAPDCVAGAECHLSILHHLIVNGADLCRERLRQFEVLPAAHEAVSGA